MRAHRQPIISDGALSAVERLLDSYTPLTPDDRPLVRALLRDFQTHTPNAQMTLSSHAASARMVVSGWVGRTVQFEDGRRQILSLALPGDLLEGATVPELCMGWIAIGTVRTADASALMAAAASGDHPSLGSALNRAQAAATERAVRHSVRLGRLSAAERAASLFLEVHDRLARADLVEGAAVPWPATQEMLADILGLSAVHVNRVLQQLRRERLLSITPGRIVLVARRTWSGSAG